MSRFETVDVPFQMAGNRQILTAVQVMDMPWIMEFIHAFAACFEFDHMRQVWVYYPNGDAPA